jgi:hypothetical protein
MPELVRSPEYMAISQYIRVLTERQARYVSLGLESLAMTTELRIESAYEHREWIPQFLETKV